MRKDLNRRLAKIESHKANEKTFRMVHVRGDTEVEQKIEFNRLKEAGLVRDDDWIIYEPRAEGKPLSNIMELSGAAVDQLIRELRDGTHGKIIVEEPVVENTTQKQ
jgi:hypothetical protein